MTTMFRTEVAKTCSRKKILIQQMIQAKLGIYLKNEIRFIYFTL